MRLDGFDFNKVVDKIEVFVIAELLTSGAEFFREKSYFRVFTNRYTILQVELMSSIYSPDDKQRVRIVINSHIARELNFLDDTFKVDNFQAIISLSIKVLKAFTEASPELRKEVETNYRRNSV